MKSTLVKLLALSMSVLMIFSLAACKSGETVSESSEPDEIVYVDENGNIIDPNALNSSSGGKDSSSNASGNNSSGGKVTTSSSNSALKGTTVVFATWKNPDTNEDGPVVKGFERKYGIDVKVDLMSQGNYINTILGRIAADNAPDVYFSTADFPSCLVCLQPIDAMKLDLSDSIWDKVILNLSTINGKTYLVNTVGCIWNDIDCVFYNKKIFNDNNITTPEEYYKAGKWTWDTLEKCMTDVKNLGGDYVGGALDSRAMIGSTGAGYFRLQNGAFSNGMDSALTDVNRRLAQWAKDGLVRGYNFTGSNYLNEFMEGSVGVAVTNAYGLKKTGYFSKMNPDNIGFTYLPDYSSSQKAVTTGIFRGWGLCRGAKNPEGAGLFLRFYLDVNNYDKNSAFISTEARDFFFKLTSGENTQNKNYYYDNGVAEAVGKEGSQYTSVFKKIPENDPNQVAAALQALKNSVDSDIKTVNDLIKKETK